jgi:hypothetical protein
MDFETWGAIQHVDSASTIDASLLVAFGTGRLNASPRFCCRESEASLLEFMTSPMVRLHAAKLLLSVLIATGRSAWEHQVGTMLTALLQ